MRDNESLTTCRISLKVHAELLGELLEEETLQPAARATIEGVIETMKIVEELLDYTNNSLRTAYVKAKTAEDAAVLFKILHPKNNTED